MKNILKSVLVIIYFYLYKISIYIPFALLDFNYEDIPVFYNIITQIVFVISLAIIYKKDLKIYLEDFKKNGISHMKVGFNYWLVGLSVMIVSNIIIGLFSPLSLPENEQAVRHALDQNAIYMAISAVLIAPVIEETLFKKTLFDMINNKKFFVIISGIIFGAFHIIGSAESLYSWLYIIPYASLGIAFSYTFVKTNNILTPIIMHSFHNLIAILRRFLLF